MLPQLAQGEANKIWVIPSEFTQALSGLSGAMGARRAARRGAAPAPHDGAGRARRHAAAADGERRRGGRRAVAAAGDAAGGVGRRQPPGRPAAQDGGAALAVPAARPPRAPARSDASATIRPSACLQRAAGEHGAGRLGEQPRAQPAPRQHGDRGRDLAAAGRRRAQLVGDVERDGAVGRQRSARAASALVDLDVEADALAGEAAAHARPAALPTSRGCVRSST